jgi:CHRD domain
MMRLQKSRTTVLALISALVLANAPQPALAHNNDIQYWGLPGPAVFPEGVAVQAATDAFFVGSTTDGTIFSGDVNSTNDTIVFLPGGGDGRTTAIGMKATDTRLYIAGGGLGQVFVYDTATKALLAKFSNGLTPTFINDVTIVPNGDAYFTDSLSPALYRLSADLATFERFTDFANTPLVYTPGFNVNGIAHTADGAYLIVVQSNTGKLFRINVATKEVIEIALNGAVLTGGDGILLVGRKLYVMRNSAALLVTLRLSSDFARADLSSVSGNPSFQFPTTFAKYGERFLVVNSQFDKRATAPVLPFNVSGIHIPEGGEGKRLEASLTGAAEVTGGDTDGSGSAIIRLKPNQGELCFNIKVKDILLPAAAAHIHVGAAGANGPVVVDFNAPPDAKGRTKGCVAAAESLVNAIWSNPAGYYVNVHNSDFPGGALRGQLMQRLSEGDED